MSVIPQLDVPNAHQRLLAVQRELAYIKKDSRHQQGYTYASAEAITAASREKLVEHGLVFTMRAAGDPIIQNGQTAHGKSQLLVAQLFDCALVNADEASDRIEFQAYGAGADPGGAGDKAFFKAMTSARREALRAILQLELGDRDIQDPEHAPTLAPEHLINPRARELYDEYLSDWKSLPMEDVVEALRNAAQQYGSRAMLFLLDAGVSSDDRDAILDVVRNLQRVEAA